MIIYRTCGSVKPRLWSIGRSPRSVRNSGMTAEISLPSGQDALEVWYDGACPLCRREIALMRRLDRARRIAFIDLAGEATTCPADRATLLARLHARENGQLLSGAAAFAAMWRAIPLLAPLGQLARIPLVLHALEWAYVRFLRVRPRLQALLR